MGVRFPLPCTFHFRRLFAASACSCLSGSAVLFFTLKDLFKGIISDPVIRMFAQGLARLHSPLMPRICPLFSASLFFPHKVTRLWQGLFT